MAFWSDAFDNLGDNLTLLGKVAEDVADNLNPFSEDFLTGNADDTAKEAERQNARREGREYDQRRVEASAKDGLGKVRDAATTTVKDVGTKAGEVVDGAGKAAGTALDLLSNPIVLGLGATALVLVLLAPYLSPVVAKALK